MSHGSDTYRPLLVLLLMLCAVYLYLKNRIRKISELTFSTMTGNEKSKEIASEVYAQLLQTFPEQIAQYVTAQAAFETGNFTSRIFYENNNLFGMKLAKKRETTAKGENRGHAVYDNIKDSIQDFVLYYKAFGYPANFKTIRDYITAIKQKKYFASDLEDYLSGVHHYLRKYFKYDFA